MFYIVHIICMLTMVIDHVGFMFFPEFSLLRGIGRISFPLYSYFLVSGYHHTGNKSKYLIRLLSLAFVSEIAYDIMVFGSISDISQVMTNQNVCFTFVIGFVAIWLSDYISSLNIKFKNGLIFAVFLLAAVIATLIKSDYMFIGIFLIYCYYLSYKIAKFNKCIAVIPFMLLNMMGSEPGEWVIYLFVLVNVLLLAIYQDKQIKVNKAFSFVNRIFYPAHMLALVLIKFFI